jgi:DNA recombination protein RmuC
MAYIAQLSKDFGRFRQDFDVVGKHIGNAASKYSEADRHLGRLETRLEQATEATELDEPATAQELPRALDAA